MRLSLVSIKFCGMFYAASEMTSPLLLKFVEIINTVTRSQVRLQSIELQYGLGYPSTCTGLSELPGRREW